MKDALPISVAYGDGVGPEIIDAAFVLLREAGASITVEVTDLGQKLYRHNVTTGVAPYSWESLLRTGVLLKGPTVAPPSPDFRRVDATLIRGLGLYASFHPVRSFAMLRGGREIDLVVIHGNESWRGGLQEYVFGASDTLRLHAQAADDYTRLIHAAFAHALRTGRRKITCVTRDNHYRTSDGSFHRLFDEISEHYPSLISEHYTLENAFHRLVAMPEKLEVIVTPQAYGTSLARLAHELAGLPFFECAAHLGERFAVFETTHDSAESLSGSHSVNPSAAILASCHMLHHLQLHSQALQIENAWLAALEDGLHTTDFLIPMQRPLLTDEFTQAVTERLGKTPLRLRAAQWQNIATPPISLSVPTSALPVQAFDIFAYTSAPALARLAEMLGADLPGMVLVEAEAKGVPLWPQQHLCAPAEGALVRLRFQLTGEKPSSAETLPDLLKILLKSNIMPENIVIVHKTN